MKNERGLVIAGFAAISIVWGSTWLAIKVGLASVPPVYGVAIRFTVAAGVLWAVMRARGGRLAFTPETVRVFSLLGASSFSIPFVLVYWGEQYVSSALASILFATYPFMVAGFSHLLLPGERLTGWKVAGTLAGFAGIVVIFWTDLSGAAASWQGMAAIVVSTVLQGFSLVMVKRIGAAIPPVPMTFGGMLFSLFILWPMALLFEEFSAIRFDAAGVGSILYLGTFGSVLTFVVYYWLLKRVEALFLSLTALITPILAVVLGAVVLDEVLGGRVYAGAALVLLGILVANGRELLNRARRGRLRFFSPGPAGANTPTSEQP